MTRPRLLVVDDDVPLLAFATRALERLDLAIEPASTAEEALERLEADDLDGLFTDVVLPGLSGLELAAQAREVRPDLPVLLTTGKREAPLLDAIAASGLPLLPKPYGLPELHGAVRSLLGLEGAEASA